MLPQMNVLRRPPTAGTADDSTRVRRTASMRTPSSERSINGETMSISVSAPRKKAIEYRNSPSRKKTLLLADQLSAIDFTSSGMKFPLRQLCYREYAHSGQSPSGPLYKKEGWGGFVHVPLTAAGTR